MGFLIADYNSFVLTESAYDGFASFGCGRAARDPRLSGLLPNRGARCRLFVANWIADTWYIPQSPSSLFPVTKKLSHKHSQGGDRPEKENKIMKSQNSALKPGRRLKIMEDFSPCPVKNGDEIYPNGIFEFNISKMIDFIHSNAMDFATEQVCVDDFPEGFSSINEEHMDNVQLGEPVILGEIAPGRYNVIDGNHRMEKARRLGVEWIPAYRIAPEQHIQFLTSAVAYKAYVEYWNSKL